MKTKAWFVGLAIITITVGAILIFGSTQRLIAQQPPPPPTDTQPACCGIMRGSDRTIGGPGTFSWKPGGGPIVGGTAVLNAADDFGMCATIENTGSVPINASLFDRRGHVVTEIDINPGQSATLCGKASVVSVAGRGGYATIGWSFRWR